MGGKEQGEKRIACHCYYTAHWWMAGQSLVLELLLHRDTQPPTVLSVALWLDRAGFSFSQKNKRKQRATRFYIAQRGRGVGKPETFLLPTWSLSSFGLVLLLLPTLCLVVLVVVSVERSRRERAFLLLVISRCRRLYHLSSWAPLFGGLTSSLQLRE